MIFKQSIKAGLEYKWGNKSGKKKDDEDGDDNKVSASLGASIGVAHIQT